MASRAFWSPDISLPPAVAARMPGIHTQIAQPVNPLSRTGLMGIRPLNGLPVPGKPSRQTQPASPAPSSQSPSGDAADDAAKVYPPYRIGPARTRVAGSLAAPGRPSGHGTTGHPRLRSPRRSHANGGPHCPGPGESQAHPGGAPMNPPATHGTPVPHSDPTAPRQPQAITGSAPNSPSRAVPRLHLTRHGHPAQPSAADRPGSHSGGGRVTHPELTPASIIGPGSHP